MGDYEIALGRIFFSVPILWILALIDGIPVLDYRIIKVYMFALPLELLAIILYIRALRLSPLSLTVPFLSFTPAILLLTSPIMLGEYPSGYGIVGIVFVVIGAYSLNLSTVKLGLLQPFKMLIKERGSLFMIVVAFIYSITSNFGKMGVLYSSPAFFAASYFSLLLILLSVIVIRRGNWKIIFRKELLIIGCFSAIMITFHMVALKLVYVSYMIALKRSSLMFGIIFGVVFLKEEGLKEKILGGIIMIAGIIIITIFS